MDASRIQKHFVAVMAKHLPPSGSAMQLLNLDGQSGCILSETRADLRTLYITPNDLPQANIASDTIDAVIAYDVGLTESMLRCVLDFLRPGGRFIVVQPRGCVSESHALRLKGCGFVRILVEPALNELGVLIRGEKPHDTADTLERIRSVARADSDSLDLKGFKGRYVHLLIQQRPNKPVWKLEKGEKLTWRATAIRRDQTPTLLAFSSLPKAVAFMQTAVLKGIIREINKVGKFSKATAHNWDWDLVLNPTPESVLREQITTVDIDPATAEAPDE